MYIDKYWGNYIGGTDDSLTLAEYLKDKRKAKISLSEIFADTGLDKLNGDFRRTEPALGYVGPKGREYPFYYAIDLVMDLAALMLECRVNGGVSLTQLMGDEEGGMSLARLFGHGKRSVICILSTPEEKALIQKALADFAENPLAYDLSEMVPREDLLETARECEKLCGEL